MNEARQHHIQAVVSEVKLYNLRVTDTGQYLSRWPSTSGAHALYSDDRDQAVEFQMEELDKLIGYMNYFRAHCHTVQVGYVPHEEGAEVA